MDMKCCSNAVLLDLLDKALNAADASQVEAHLAQCPACRGRLAEISGGFHFLRSEMPALAGSIRPPEFLALRIKHKIAHVDDNRNWWQRQGGSKWAAAAAIFIIIAAGIVYRTALPSKPTNFTQSPPPATVQAQTPQILVIMPSLGGRGMVRELPRRDGLPPSMAGIGPSDPVPDDGVRRAVPAAQPQPTVHSPVRVVKPASYDPEM